MLCGCASFPQKSSDGPAPAPLRRDLLALLTCESLLTQEPLPKLKAGDIADVAVQREDAAIMNANGRLRTGRACVAGVRTKYAGE